jgi:ferric-dicitrate binding protein FerR (iron transport regulator)
MTRPAPNDTIWQLIDDLVNGTISDVDAELLQQRLAADPSLQRLYLDYCALHGSLIFEVQKSEAFSRVADELKAARNPLVCRRARPTKSRWLAIGGWVSAAAILFAIVLWSALSLDDGRTAGNATDIETQLGGANVEDPTQPATQAAFAAIVSGMIDCEATCGDQLVEPGDSFLAGAQLEVKSGSLQLTFESGAEAMVQAPARFVIESRDACRLDDGSLAVKVPESAKGFSLLSKRMEVIDLGTEFGARVSDDGTFDLHVLDGEVVAWPQDGSEQEIRLLAGNAVTLPAGRRALEYHIASPQQFVRVGTTKSVLPELPPLPVTSKLALWLAADVGVRTDEENRVVSWRDIPAGDNQSTEDAWQRSPDARPKLVRNAIHGKPAVRFDGESDYLGTTPLLSTRDQTLFFVFSRASDFEQPSSLNESIQRSRQLINYNGPPHEPRERIQPQERHALQICDRLSPGLYWGRVFETMERGRSDVHLGSVVARDVVGVDQPVILTYAYHPSVNRGALFINGKLQGVDTAPLSAEFSSCKVIGRASVNETYFHGDIAEVLIYNGALSGEQISSVNSYLGGKYSINLATQPVQLVDMQPEQQTQSTKVDRKLIHIGNGWAVGGPDDEGVQGNASR